MLFSVVRSTSPLSSDFPLMVGWPHRLICSRSSRVRFGSDFQRAEHLLGECNASNCKSRPSRRYS